MIATIVICAITCLLIVLSSLLKPSIKIKKVNLNLYWIIALIGAIFILCFQLISFDELWKGLTNQNSINPIQILILFLSMSLISIFLDEVGFFSYLASYVLKRTKNSQFKIFTALYILIALLTMFTSNDIVILTLTPFIIFFCKRAKISAIPYLVSEFVCANTWSMMFLIGNPTNIFLSQSFNVTFIDYFLKMAVPTLAAGLLEFLILYLLFRKKLSDPIERQDIELPYCNKILTIIGLSILLICTVFLIISSYIKLPMYLISAVSLGVLLVLVLIYQLIRKEKPVEILRTLKRGPYELIPFVIGMFVLVLALEKQGVTNEICKFFGETGVAYSYGYSSLLAANLLNNIPMSVVYTSILSGLSGKTLEQAMYAVVIGSNIGAFITPVGALAGIMWMGILKNHDIKYSFIDFIKYGIIIGIPVASIAIVIMAIM